MSSWGETSLRAEENPEYLESIGKAVEDFRVALESFLELHVVNQTVARGIMPAVLPRDDASPDELKRRMSVVDRAAGRAGPAAQLTHVKIGVQGAGMIDSITAWASMTKPNPLLEPDDVIGAADLMLGRLETMILKAKAEAPPEIGAAAMHPLVWEPRSRSGETATIGRRSLLLPRRWLSW